MSNTTNTNEPIVKPAPTPAPLEDIVKPKDSTKKVAAGEDIVKPH